MWVQLSEGRQHSPLMRIEGMNELVESLPGAGGKATGAFFPLGQHHQGRHRQRAFGGQRTVDGVVDHAPGRRVGLADPPERVAQARGGNLGRMVEQLKGSLGEQEPVARGLGGDVVVQDVHG